MNDRDLKEIRRRFRPDKNNISYVRGCIVNSTGTISSVFSQPLATVSTEESEKLLASVKKILSGSMGVNLYDMSFSTKQVEDSDEHRLLTKLRDSALKDEEALREFYTKIAENVKIDGGYAILMAHEVYDVFSYSKSGDKEETSSQTFPYFICAICPIKPIKSGLYFKNDENMLRSVSLQTAIGTPTLGFMFPAFENRSANIYNALFYTRDISDLHPAFVQSIFNTEVPMSAPEQKESFTCCLKEALETECDLEVVRAVHEQVAEMIEVHKESKDDEPLTLTKEGLKNILAIAGVEQEKADAFGERFDEQFGKNAEVTPKSIVDTKKYKLETADVVIKVNPERKDLVTTQIIDGVKYIMIRAEGGVELNGIDIDIK